MKSTPILSFPILLPSPPLHLLTSCLKFHWVHLVLPNMCMGVGPSSKSMKWLLRAYVSEKKKKQLFLAQQPSTLLSTFCICSNAML